MKNSVASFRRDFNFTQEDLSIIVGCSRNAISAIECGTSAPSIQMAYKIAAAFGVDIYDVFCFDEIKEPFFDDISMRLTNCNFVCDGCKYSDCCNDIDCYNRHLLRVLGIGYKNVKKDYI